MAEAKTEEQAIKAESFSVSKEAFRKPTASIFKMRIFEDTDVLVRVEYLDAGHSDAGPSQQILFNFELKTKDTMHCWLTILIQGVTAEYRSRTYQLFHVDTTVEFPSTQRCVTHFNFEESEKWGSPSMDIYLRLMFTKYSIAPRRLMNDFASPLFNEKTFSDVAVVCGDRIFYCHKIILARSSTYFMAMLSNQFKEARENKIEIPNFEPDVAELLLKFVYTDTVDEKLITWDLFEAAKMYDLARLQHLCLKSLRDRLDVNSCCRTLEASFLHDLSGLFDLALMVLQRNKAEVAKTEDWERVAENSKLMEKILQLVA